MRTATRLRRRCVVVFFCSQFQSTRRPHVNGDLSRSARAQDILNRKHQRFLFFVIKVKRVAFQLSNLRMHKNTLAVHSCECRKRQLLMPKTKQNYSIDTGRFFDI